MARLALSTTLLALFGVTQSRPTQLPFEPFLPSNKLAPISCPPPPPNASDDFADFLILGAGMAGLGAAHYLHAHTDGCTIRVIEARDVPGGRVRTLDEGAFAGMEIGAGWIHEYRGNPMLAVADANGIYTKWVGGNSSYVGGDLIRIFDGDTELDDETRHHSFQLMETITAGIEDEALWRLKTNASDTSVLDSVLNLTSNLPLSPFDRRLTRWNLDVVYGGDWASPMAELSVKSHAHGYLNYEGGDCVFPDGFSQVPRALALGIDVKYGQVVRNITWGEDGVALRSENDNVWNGRKLLITQSIGVLQSDLLSFTPPLPASKRDIINKFDMSALNRVMLRFPYPFWGNDTYTLGFLPQHSEIFEDATDDDDEDDDEWATVPLFSVAVNAGYEDRPVGSAGVLTFMTGGDSGDNLLSLSKNKIVRSVIRTLRSAFGKHAVPDPTDVHISDWASEVLARGSYSSVPVGTSVHHDTPSLAIPVRARLRSSSKAIGTSCRRNGHITEELGEPVLFFAGEATLAGPARGTTHGAFLSGIREAARMLGRERVVAQIWEADLSSMDSARYTDSQVQTRQQGRGGLVLEGWFEHQNVGLVVQV